MISFICLTRSVAQCGDGTPLRKHTVHPNDLPLQMNQSKVMMIQMRPVNGNAEMFQYRVKKTTDRNGYYCTIKSKLLGYKTRFCWQSVNQFDTFVSDVYMHSSSP